MSKVNKIFVRIGFDDLSVPLEDKEMVIVIQDSEGNSLDIDTFVVGYEDEDGNECDENGNYLDE